jgi:hypothetical protein
MEGRKEGGDGRKEGRNEVMEEMRDDGRKEVGERKKEGDLATATS